MEYYIDNRQTKYKVTKELESLIEKVILESLKVEGLEGNFEVSISLVENEEIRELNRDYRNVDSITDVLSFPIEDEFDFANRMLGDIIISIERAEEQAVEFGHTLEREIAYLTCHSMFHLMGYDHMEDDEKSQMRVKEKQVMKNLKIFKE